MSYHQSRRPRAGATRSFGGNRRPSGRSFQAAPRKGAKQYINPSRFIRAARPITVEAYQHIHSFDDFAMHPLIKRNVAAKGFTAPSKIQDLSIPHGLEGKDVLGIANTGTGKTTAFALPVLNKLMDDRNTRALIMAPTRELALQIEDECRSFAKGSGLFGALIIGGAPMQRQIRDLQSRPRIVIGTPGRLKDHVQRGTLNLTQFSIVVLDEVDRMVDMGFINDMRFLLGQLATPRQSLFFSATMDAKVEGLVHSFMQNPVTVSVRTGETSDNVEQNIVRHNGKTDKLNKLHDLLIDEQVAKVLIFDETKRSVERLSQELIERGFRADALHGGKSQGQRQRALNKFRANEINVLVATDVAARGIDVADITHVINFSTPNTYDDYTHRIGRAGRAGRKGHALTFVGE